MRLRSVLPCLWLAATALLAVPERTQVTVLATADLHGNIFPIDYTTNTARHHGLAKVATLIREIRQAQPNVILLDAGDTIQGTPLAYHHNRINNEPISPMMLTMNALGFDAMTVGNHEFNFGLPVLQKARREAQFPWLSANTLDESTGEPAFPPYLVREVGGVRVGILGITTPGIPGWENPNHYAGLTFADPVATTRRYVAHLREQEKVDVVVVAMHMGLEENLATGQASPGQMPQENTALAIARAVPGIDLICMAHTHRSVNALVVNGALLAQPGRWGDHLVRADVYLERASPEAEWTIVAKSSDALPVTADTVADAEILALAAPYHEATQAWLDQPIGHSARRLTAEDARLRDTAIIDLIHRTQLAAGDADVSFAAAFNPGATLPAGPVTVREIAGLYVYENTLVVLELTGAQIKEALEHAARYFLPWQPGRSPAELINPEVPGYNFDMAEGVEYTIDLSRPLGDRIVDLRYQGAPLDPDQRLRVATNNYRHNGGGGYTMFRDAPVLDRSNTEIRELIIDWVREHREIPPEPTGNWQIVAP